MAKQKQGNAEKITNCKIILGSFKINHQIWQSIHNFHLSQKKKKNRDVRRQNALPTKLANSRGILDIKTK